MGEGVVAAAHRPCNGCAIGVRHRLARMGDSRASPRPVIGAAEPPDRQGLYLRPREMLPNALICVGRVS